MKSPTRRTIFRTAEKFNSDLKLKVVWLGKLWRQESHLYYFLFLFLFFILSHLLSMDLIITVLSVVTKDLPISPRFTPYDFLSLCKFSTLTTRQPMVELQGDILPASANHSTRHPVCRHLSSHIRRAAAERRLMLFLMGHV